MIPFSSTFPHPDHLSSLLSYIFSILGAFIHFHWILVSHNCQEGPGLIICFCDRRTLWHCPKCILLLCIYSFQVKVWKTFLMVHFCGVRPLFSTAFLLFMQLHLNCIIFKSRAGSFCTLHLYRWWISQFF